MLDGLHMNGQDISRSTPGDDLATKAAAGDAAAFAALVEAEYDRIFRLAWRFTGSRDHAEDIAQDVCVKLAGAIRGFRGESAFSTWLYRLVFTTATDALRKTQRFVLVEPSKMQLVADLAVTATPETAAIDGELWDAVRALPPQQRDAVTFVYGEDMSHAEAASIMGCTEKTVSWHLHEAKKRLKRVLDAAPTPTIELRSTAAKTRSVTSHSPSHAAAYPSPVAPRALRHEGSVAPPFKLQSSSPNQRDET